MYINKITGNMKKNFIFILRRPDGTEYENVVSANSEDEAKQRLKNILEIFRSQDEIVGLKETR
jgi:ABC-type metal ion transport system substrate-binding protein